MFDIIALCNIMCLNIIVNCDMCIRLHALTLLINIIITSRYADKVDMKTISRYVDIKLMPTFILARAAVPGAEFPRHYDEEGSGQRRAGHEHQQEDNQSLRHEVGIGCCGSHRCGSRYRWQ